MVRFVLCEKDLQALVALAEDKNRSVSQVLRGLVRTAIREHRKADDSNHEQRDEATTV
jgi:hypothetical protein